MRQPLAGLEPDVMEFITALRGALAAALGDESLQIEALNRRGEGYSWETYLIAARRGAPSHILERYAVKREPQAGLLGSYDVHREVALLRTTRIDIGCPVPRVIAFEPRDGKRRGFYVMEMIDGVVPMPWDVKRIIPDEATCSDLGLELAGIMGKLHGKDVSELRIDGMIPPADPGSVGMNETQKWRRIYLESKAVHLSIIDLAFALVGPSRGFGVRTGRAGA